MVAVIGDSANQGSIALHRARGFADAGVFKAAGWKHDGPAIAGPLVVWNPGDARLMAQAETRR